MDDLIRRTYDKACFSGLLEEVPATCKFWDAESNYCALYRPSAQPQRIHYSNMSDAEFERWLYEHGICHPNIHESIPCDVVPLLIDNAISELSSAQPERKKGKWKLNKDGNWACPFCEFDPYHDNMKGMNYCPNCGAEMER